MDTNRKSEIAFAEGFIEDFVLSHASKDGENQHSTQLRTMWETLSAGIKEYRFENIQLEDRLQSAKNALL